MPSSLSAYGSSEQPQTQKNNRFHPQGDRAPAEGSGLGAIVSLYLYPRGICKTGSWGKKKMPPPRAGVLWVFLFSKQPWGWRQSRMNQSEDLQTHTLSRFSHVRLCDPMDCSPPGSSVHEILQARILEWVAVPSSRDSSQPWDQTCISFVSCIGRRALYRTT